MSDFQFIYKEQWQPKQKQLEKLELRYLISIPSKTNNIKSVLEYFPSYFDLSFKICHK